MKLLVVEDNRAIAETIGDYFTLRGHVVEFAFHGKMALEILEDQVFDIMVLDVMMPKLDGFETIEAIRKKGLTLPVIMLTARDTLDDRLLGFNKGVDDYLVKPFAIEELEARIHAICNRGERKDVGVLVLGPLRLDLNERRASRDDKPLALNKTQFLLLKELATHAPALVAREVLENRLWADDPPDTDALRTHTYRLRSIVDKGFSYPMIETVHGKGYRLVAEVV